MGVGADDQIDVFRFKPQIPQARLDMTEQGAVAGVDQDPGRTINEIGIAIVACHGLPDEGVKVIYNLHRVIP
jgi:hypothetical protein